MSAKNLHPNTAKIELATPVKISGVEVNHLIMRRPKLRDRIAAQKAAPHEADMTVYLAASLCEVPVEDLHEMDGYDWNQVESALQVFLDLPPS